MVGEAIEKWAPSARLLLQTSVGRVFNLDGQVFARYENMENLWIFFVAAVAIIPQSVVGQDLGAILSLLPNCSVSILFQWE